jgi:hypothetical protein
MLSSKWAWLDLFKYCKFLRLLGHVMVLLVLGIVAFTYYTVVALQYGPGIVRGGFLSALGCTLVVVLFTALVSRARGAAPRNGPGARLHRSAGEQSPGPADPARLVAGGDAPVGLLRRSHDGPRQGAARLAPLPG